ncbi:tryptophan transporter, putative [Pediculus humanus corporis]|uniref:Transporter n=1 Tax=Pediculus humanus subsp. corporis TaxID=121224 RepID=E0V9M5_PEDHC|nr:tryptophan transporter, putative [Pediculus humanus corporis]EEB10081.1 tryptophan transporter, putative [Pediculus humanus corporis]
MPRRVQWANKTQFILACVGYSIGLGNIWRFPYVCYKSGGGAFLVPYVLALFVCGIPLLYMELMIGQLTKRGPIGALGKLCPLLKGAGLSSVVISFIMSTYCNVIIAYTIYYLFTSLNSKLPWHHCDNPWNTINCWMPSLRLEQNITKPNMSRTPSQEFYDNKVLQITSGLEILGKFRWELVACLIVAWILVYFSIWKSIKSSGKVIYITATLPYVLILAFLVRSVTLEGADVGLSYLFNPQWELLGDAKVWVNAAGQVFNSIGLAFGSIISFSSYKKPNDRILIDTITVSCINAGTSLLVGIFAFAIIGNIATEHRTSVHDVITDGPGLVFVVYPEAMAKMPASQLWAILFFTMLFCVGLNSQFAIVEVVVTAIQDGFPNWIRRNFGGHEVLVLAVCFVSFVLGLPNVFQGGIFFFQLIDHYAASISIMYLSFFELIAFAWFYGYRRLKNNLKEMTGETPSLYFKFCWCIAAPAFLMEWRIQVSTVGRRFRLGNRIHVFSLHTSLFNLRLFFGRREKF